MPSDAKPFDATKPIPRLRMGTRVRSRLDLVDCFLEPGLLGTVVDSQTRGTVMYLVKFDKMLDTHPDGRWTDEDRIELAPSVTFP